MELLKIEAKKLEEKETWIRDGLKKWLVLWAEKTAGIKNEKNQVTIFKKDYFSERFGDYTRELLLECGYEHIINDVDNGDGFFTGKSSLEWYNEETVDKMSIKSLREIIKNLPGKIEEMKTNMEKLNEETDDVIKILNALIPK